MMKLIIFLIIAFSIVAIGLVIKLFYKNSMERLLIPGPLTASHAKYESDCAKCHYSFKKANQNDLCLSCHKETAEDIKSYQGLHGKSSLVKDKLCKSCHTEHKGRAFNNAYLDKEIFNHSLTDFALVGAHARASVTCEACHLQGKKYRDAPGDCFSCHAKNDIHKGRLGENCGNCHKETLWNDAYFDHMKTSFPLEGKHKQTACSACHMNEEYKNTPIDCVACHLVNDIHASSPKQDCDQCHGLSGWKIISYDHNKETKFILKGKHEELKCDSCHPQNIFNKDKPGSACFDCHKADDAHKGKLGEKCESCHVSVNWKEVTFDHNRGTDFALVGRHAGLQCASCHKDSSGKMDIDTSCYSCHEKDDTHRSQQGIKCGLCHNQNKWKETTKFDHDLTSFPLIGLHAALSCSECHTSSAFKDSDTACISCHRPDDYHKGALGKSCAACHNPNGWKLWEFDHNTQTTYKLEGAHEGLACKACHSRPVGRDIQLSNDCSSCHERDDVHHGRFGQQCDRCHTAETFKKILLKSR